MQVNVIESWFMKKKREHDNIDPNSQKYYKTDEEGIRIQGEEIGEDKPWLEAIMRLWNQTATPYIPGQHI